MGKLAPREEASLEYAEALRNRYQYHPQVKRIARHRHVPKMIHKAAVEKRIILDSQKRKLNNCILHSKPRSVKAREEEAHCWTSMYYLLYIGAVYTHTICNCAYDDS